MGRIAALALVACLAVVATTSCGETYTQKHSFVRTSTVPLGRQTTMIVDAPVQLIVVGHPRSSDLVYRLEATITASTASVARQLADAVTVTTEDIDPAGIQVIVGGLDFTNGTIQGALEITVPSDMDVVAVGRGGPVDVTEMGGSIKIDAITHTRIVGAVGSVDVGVERGNAVVSSNALPGTTINLRTRNGDVQLLLPSLPSVVLQAQAGGGGQILIQHPRFPPWLGGDLPYGTSVGGGLSQALLTTEVGNIIVGAQ